MELARGVPLTPKGFALAKVAPLPMLTQQGFPPCTPTSVARLTAFCPPP